MNSYQMVLHRPVETAPVLRALQEDNDYFRIADHPEVALNSVCDHPAAAGIYPQSALALGTFA
jgi:hypothetical protein